MASQSTLEERQTELESLKTKKELIAEGAKVNLVIDPDLKMAQMVSLILGATFGDPTAPVASEVLASDITSSGTEGALAGPVDAIGSGSTEQGENVSPADKEGTAGQEAPVAPPAPEDPLAAQASEIDVQLAALYDALVEQIKDVSVDGSKLESAEQIRAGAVQFLRQCNATLESARQFVKTGEKLVEENNAQLQNIDKASKALEKRSEDYRRLTSSGGEKNVA